MMHSLLTTPITKKIMPYNKASIKNEIFLWAGFSILYALLAMLSFQSRDAWSFSSTIWFPSSLLFATLWLTARHDWPLWLVTAGILHMLAGLYIGRPWLLATIFSGFDMLVFPFCVLAFRQGWQLLERFLSRNTIWRELIYILIIVLCNFSGSMLLNLSLLIVGYAVDFSHFTAWALASITGMLSILPLLRDENRTPSTPVPKKIFLCRNFLLGINTAAVVIFFVTPVGYTLMGFNSLFFQLAFLLLSVSALTTRQSGILLMIQYSIVIVATIEHKGLFYNHMSSLEPAIYQAQCYLIISSILVTCINHLVLENRKLIREIQNTDLLIYHLSQTSTWIIFNLNMPEKALTWRGPSTAFFPGETVSVSTLDLLEAHCETLFIEEFDSWYALQESRLFQKTLIVQRLNGERLCCLLQIQRTESLQHLIGGLSVINNNV